MFNQINVSINEILLEQPQFTLNVDKKYIRRIFTMNIMVTGATGEYGNYALQYLEKVMPKSNLYALVRNPQNATKIEQMGINVRIGDYANLDSLLSAFHGIDRLLFVSTSIPKIQKNVVDAAKVNGITYIAYTSIYRPELNKFGLELNHRQTEKWIEESGIRHTFLRNDWYLEVNQAMFNLAAQTQQFPLLNKSGILSYALKREYAEAGAKIILADNYGPVANLAGKPFTYQQLAEATESALGQKLNIQSVSKDQFNSIMRQAKISPQFQQAVALYQEYSLDPQNGAAEANSSEFENILGHPLTSLPNAIKSLL